jgi:hypothetical protein
MCSCRRGHAPGAWSTSQPELTRRLVAVQIVVWIAGPRERRRVGRQAEMREDVTDRLALGDDGEHPKWTAALGTRHHIHVE